MVKAGLLDVQVAAHTAEHRRADPVMVAQPLQLEPFGLQQRLAHPDQGRLRPGVGVVQPTVVVDATLIALAEVLEAVLGQIQLVAELVQAVKGRLGDPRAGLGLLNC